MQRLTKTTGCGYVVDESLIGEAVERLARFENMIERLIKEQNDTAAQLEKLRKEGREKSITFKQLLARKLLSSNMLALFESHGIRASF